MSEVFWYTVQELADGRQLFKFYRDNLSDMSYIADPSEPRGRYIIKAAHAGHVMADEIVVNGVRHISGGAQIWVPHGSEFGEEYPERENQPELIKQ